MRWWETAVFYQIYPRSFRDTDGDGLGDLKGIEAGLPYLEKLGVGALWISPFYPSPMRDFGYDIADYCGIDPLFGTLADFKSLLSSAHEKGIRIIIDLVINHSSDEHPWFREARSSRDNPKHDWYIWKPIRRGLLGRYKKPNNWVSQFELRSAWFPNEATGEYYLGTFSHFQPEFDWRNPELRKAMYEVIRFWLDLGVDGFRMDVVNWYIKDRDFRSNPRSLCANPDIFLHHIYDRNQPETHEICREIRKIADSYPGDRVLVGEIFCRDPAQAASYHGKNLDELQMAFNMELLYRAWSASAFRTAIRRWYAALPEGAWPNFTLSNHDQIRHISRLGGSSREERLSRAKVAAALLLTLRGTPFVYYGEELGLEQVQYRRRELRDPQGIKTWPLKGLGRDGCRSPLPWNGTVGGGFSSGIPWLRLGKGWKEANVETEEGDGESLLAWYRSLIARRRESKALTEGDIRFVDSENPSVVAYTRTSGAEQLLVVLNFSAASRTLPQEASSIAGSRSHALGPYEVRIVAY